MPRTTARPARWLEGAVHTLGTEKSLGAPRPSRGGSGKRTWPLEWTHLALEQGSASCRHTPSTPQSPPTPWRVGDRREPVDPPAGWHRVTEITHKSRSLCKLTPQDRGPPPSLREQDTPPAGG